MFCKKLKEEEKEASLSEIEGYFCILVLFGLIYFFVKKKNVNKQNKKYIQNKLALVA